MTRDASLDTSLHLDTLLESLRTCHEPSPADTRRVRQALDARLADLGSLTEEQEASGVHPKPQGEPLFKPPASERVAAFAGRVRRSRLLLGAVAVAAVAAVAVVTLAHPASFEPGSLAALGREGDGQEGSMLTADELKSSNERPLALLDEPPRESGRARPVPFVHEASCRNWPCLDAEPAVVLSLGGAEIARRKRVAQAQAPAPEAAGDQGASAMPGSAAPERDRGPDVGDRRGHRVQIAPVLALDVARDGVTPGAGLRIAVPVSDERDLTLEATLQRFEVEAASGRSLWAIGGAGCWRPVAGKVDLGLCGDLGYERAAAAAGDEWRLTAGASAYAAWNLTRSATAYLAMQAVVPVAGDGLGERGTVMRVVAGPRLNF